MACVGDHYTYDVTANSKKEAFDKLVIHFFGKRGCSNDIESHANTISREIRDSFGYTGMPRWFAKRLSGYVKEPGENYQEELEKYAKENNIELDKNN